MATYFISGVWKDIDKRITHVLLHETNEGNYRPGTKKTEAAVIRLINLGNDVSTITWNYDQACWYVRMDVMVVTRFGLNYLRSHQNGTVNDNLDNLIDLEDYI